MSRKSLSLVASMMFASGALTSAASAESAAQADASDAALNEWALPTITGDCRVPATGEVVTISPRDPLRNFGMVAVGQSKAGTDIMLQEALHNELFLTLGTSLVVIPVDPSGLAIIRASTIDGHQLTANRLTCDFQIQLNH